MYRPGQSNSKICIDGNTNSECYRKSVPLTLQKKRTEIRITLVISSVIVALAIPYFGSLMSLVGAFLSVTASILLPCLCYLKISGTHRRLGLEAMILGSIVLVGIVILVVGTYTSLVQIIGDL